MAEVASAYVTLIPSAKGFARKAEGEITPGMSAAGASAGSKASSGFASKFGAGIKKAAKLAAVGLAAGVAVAGKALWDAGQAAGDLEETLSKTNAIFGGAAAKNLEKWSKGAAKELGMSQQTALDAAGTFGVFGKAAGKSGGELAKFSKDNAKLAADLASFHNTSPEEAIEAIGAAFRGEAEPMRKYGVLLDDASMRQQALKMGLIKTTKDALTPQQKTLAAQALIMKQTGDAQGDFARTSGGLANQQRILKAQFENVQASIGRKVLPVLLQVATWANDKLIPALSDVWQWLASKLGPVFSTVAAEVKGFVSGFKEGAGAGGKFADALRSGGDVVKKFGAFLVDNKDALIAVGAGLLAAKVSLVAYNAYVKISTALTKAWTIAQKLLNGTMRANPVGIVITAIALLVAGLVLAYKKSETFRKIVDGAFKAVGKAGKWLWDNALKPAFKAMGDGFKAVGKAGVWLWNNALQPAFRFIVKGVAAILDMWAKMLRALSKVPGFGWAGKAADAMAGAAKRAREFADGINKIPTGKNVKITVDVPDLQAVSERLDWVARPRQARITITQSYANAGRETRGGLQARAHGGPVTAGTPYLVGERGPEIVVPRHSGTVIPNHEIGTAAGGQTFNIHEASDARATAYEVARMQRFAGVG